MRLVIVQTLAARIHECRAEIRALDYRDIQTRLAWCARLHALENARARRRAALAAWDSAVHLFTQGCIARSGMVANRSGFTSPDSTARGL